MAQLGRSTRWEVTASETHWNTSMIGTRIHITGIVQGVGFRPFVYTQAVRHGLLGWVCNTSAGVDIEVSGELDDVTSFIHNLQTKAPALARIDSIEYHPAEIKMYQTFDILESKELEDAFQPISPDISICPDCLAELFDPDNRRYRYPFINCTNCGPRLTIIDDIPYDRPYTTMKEFEMCPDCRSEYSNPLDRRFHAQPIACQDCGPQVWLEVNNRNDALRQTIIAKGDAAILATQKMLKKGKIIAIKGLGGFHLACDATNPKAVAELRKRKLRIDKPFAVMMPDIATVEAHCQIDTAERELLESSARPIVIIARKESTSIANEVSPNQKTLGVMLPYTPLHYLLFSSTGDHRKRKGSGIPPLVMTSGNLSEEPIAVQNHEAREHLSSLADAFLMHNRKIRTRCDDSVVRTFHMAIYPFRRSRGYAPFPVYLKTISPHILATGAELKNTFCIVRDKYAFLSHHIGDMENVETFDSYAEGIAHYEALFRVKPSAIAYDLHPNYLSTRYAIERAEREKLPSFAIQHHHAHITSCMAENSLPADRPVIGVAFDGTGYGEDGAIWGGEFLVADYQKYNRVAHLKYIPLPGGDIAIRKPARTALAYLWSGKLDWEPELEPVSSLCAEERSILKSQLEHKINTPLTSSMGRFFDAVAAICGGQQKVNYEAQAAVEFEAMADREENGEYNLPLEPDGIPGSGRTLVVPFTLIEEILADLYRGVSVSIISARFHNSIARMVSQVCSFIRNDFGITDVILSGGVWQNMTLLHRTYDLLIRDQFNLYTHHLVPTNDGGLSLGQAVIAIHKLTS